MDDFKKLSPAKTCLCKCNCNASYIAISFILTSVLIVSLQSRDRIGTGGQVVDCSRLFDNDLPDG